MRLRSVAIPVSTIAFALAWFLFTSATPERTEGMLSTDPPTPYVRFMPASEPIRTVLVVHGLNSNKEFMQSLSMAFADAGFETYTIDLPGHGDSRDAFTYSKSLQAIAETLDRISPDPPVVVGHSLGGALLADLAALRRFETMILISPAPTAVETLQTDRLLLVTGGMDAPRVNEFAPSFLEAAGSESEWWNFAGSTHSTTVFDPQKLRMIVEWAGGRPESLRMVERFLWLGVMVLAGVATPLLALGRQRLKRPGPSSPSNSAVANELGWRVIAMAITLIALRVVDPFEWLNLFATDYLVGFLFVAGLLLWRGRGLSISMAGAGIAVISAVYVLVVFALVIGSQLIHLVPSQVQWFRVPIIAAAGFPLFLYDERTLRPILPHWRHWLIVLLSRVLLAAAIVTGVLVAGSGNSFLVLVLQFFVAFWLVLWWMTGLVHQVTGEPGAAALFAALIQGWAFAATFVTI